MLAASIALAFAGSFSNALATTHVVTQCADSTAVPVCNGIDDGTLRQAFACAQQDDSVDLSQLQCSKITLAAPLTSGPVSLSLEGPGRDQLTIEAGGSFRTLVHNGQRGTRLNVQHLTIAGGTYVNPYNYGGGGGCIFSSGDVTLVNSTVSSCYTAAASTQATGGAIFAKGDVVLISSAVTGSTANGLEPSAKYIAALGGGIFADSVELYGSSVTGNTVSAAMGGASGGGVYAVSFYARDSTIAGNMAQNAGGVWAARGFTIVQSTISGNHASAAFGGAVLVSNTAGIYNSTIAFNSAGSANSPGGVSFGSALIVSSILAHNSAGGVPYDLGVASVGGSSGSNNLIMSGTGIPPGTITDDPMLAALRDNGIAAATHALRPGSPAIDHGSNPKLITQDERGAARTLGPAIDIGAYERNPDELFDDGFD
jgi:hypothetical protein